MRRSGWVGCSALAAVALSLSGCSGASSGTGGTASGSAAGGGASSLSVVKDAASSTHQVAPGNSTKGSSGGVKVCSLLSAAKASSLSDIPYDSSVSKHLMTGYDQCTYKNAHKGADPVNIFDLEVSVLTIAGCYQQESSAIGPGEPVVGVASRAFGYGIGIVVDAGGKCIEVAGMTHKELQGDYSHDVAMAKVVLAAMR